MRWYWSLDSIPELDGLPATEKQRLWLLPCRRPVRRWLVWASMPVGMVCLSLVILAAVLVALRLDEKARDTLSNSPVVDVCGIIGILVGALVSGYVVGAVYFAVLRSEIRRARQASGPSRGA